MCWSFLPKFIVSSMRFRQIGSNYWTLCRDAIDTLRPLLRLFRIVRCKIFREVLLAP
jgi:hypothetical protein